MGNYFSNISNENNDTNTKTNNKTNETINQYFINKNLNDFVKCSNIYKIIIKESEFNNYDIMETYYFYNDDNIIVKVFVKITYRENYTNDILDFNDNPHIGKNISEL